MSVRSSVWPPARLIDHRNMCLSAFWGDVRCRSITVRRRLEAQKLQYQGFPHGHPLQY
ncbi:hypothetical protein K440DRAFT_620868 [Wilcoxina mikolae CBS 423.85]|nr:hypothetical protein K440DRAFT_620868 [Wilcoxina mikolae CBS 423.85]